MIKTAVDIFLSLKDFGFEGDLEGAATDLDHLKEIKNIQIRFGQLDPKVCKQVGSGNGASRRA